MASDKAFSGDMPMIENDHLFQTIVESIPSAVFIYQGDKVIYANHYTEPLTGYALDELLAMPFWTFIHPDFQALIQQRSRARLAGEDVPNNYDFKIVRKDGDIRWVNWRANVIELDGKLAVMGVGDDITAGKQAEELLMQTQARHEEAQRIAQLGHWTLDLVNNELTWSNEVYRMFGVDPKVFDASYEAFLNIVHPDDRESVKKAYESAVKDKVPYNTEHRLLMQDGSVKWVNERCETFYDEAGEPLRSIGTVLDITKRKQSENRLQSVTRLSARTTGDDFFRTLVSSVAEALQVKAVFVAAFVSNQPISARSLALWIDGGQAENMQWSLSGTPCEQVAQGQSVFVAKDVQALFPDDAWLSEVGLESYLGIPLISNHGRVLGHIGVMDDKPIFEQQEFSNILNIFADRVVAELERKQVDERLQLSQFTIDHSTDAAFWFDQDANFIDVNDTACRRLGYTRDELLTMSVFDIDVEFPRQAWPEHWQTIKKQGLFHLQSVHKTKSGKTIPVEISITHVCFEGRECNFAFATDISVRKESEKRLLKLSSAIEQAGESMMITDKEGLIEYVNPAFTQLTGYSAEEAIGQTPRLLNSGNQDAAFYKQMWHTISSGQVWHGKVIDRKKDGSFYPTTLTISPIHGESGETTHFVGIQSDLTRIEDLEHQFHQAQKMEAIGTLVGGIAHDFNNMLAGMTGNLYLAKRQTEAMPDVAQKLTNVEELSFRAADMIQQLLTFSRKSMVNMKPMPLTPFIKETLKLLRVSIPENISFDQYICTDMLEVTGDNTQLHQVLMNLLNNARDAVEGVDEPTITVRLDAFHADDLFTDSRAYFAAGLYAHLSVQDNGCGIPAHQLEHLFEPFFTTKEQGKGTGLGLAMVYGAVKTHHGFVEVDSIEGEGSTFHVYLPLLETEKTAVASAQGDEIVEGNGETILLVDDEQHIIETGKEVLEALGYRVLTAMNGQQAVDLFEAHSEEIDLCIFDVVMPVMGGDKAARCIRQFKADARIVFATGYDKNLLTDMAQETVLTKPFAIAELSQVIRQQLDG